MRYQYTTMDTIFSKMTRDFGSEWDEGDVIEWTGEALEHSGGVKSYEEAVAFMEVKNHQVEIPKYMHSIIQIARNWKWTPYNCEPPKVIVEEMNLAYNTIGCNGCKDQGYVVLDQQGMPLVEYDVAYYRPYFDLIGEYYLWSNTYKYMSDYVPVRLSNHSFFNSLVCTLTADPLNPNSKQVYNEPRGDDEYTIVAGKILRFSFREGYVAVAYTRQVVDKDTGYPMVPDNISFREAITMYCTMKILRRQCYAGRQGTCNLAKEAEDQWDWYCGQASNLDKMPHGEDEHQNLLEQRQYILPRQNRYYGFFGNLGKKEFRKFNDPNGRSRLYTYVS